jgi:hypothetical protein
MWWCQKDAQCSIAIHSALGLGVFDPDHLTFGFASADQWAFFIIKFMQNKKPAEAGFL